MKKPSPEIFRKVIEITGGAPEEVIFVDDSEENVRSAVNVGMKGVLFSSPEKLREEFKGMGLL